MQEVKLTEGEADTRERAEGYGKVGAREFNDEREGGRSGLLGLRSVRELA
jgi:hypothetical protein